MTRKILHCIVLPFILSCCAEPTSSDKPPHSSESVAAPADKSQSHDRCSAVTDDRTIEPGTYGFVGRVRSVQICRYDVSRLNGVADIGHERFVFMGIDPRWQVAIAILSIEDSIWFLEKGKRVNFVVHSPSHLFYGDDDGLPLNQIRRFELTITRSRSDEGMFFSSLSAEQPGPESREVE